MNLIDMLTERGVSIRTQKYVVDGGIEYAVGEPHRCAYANSECGRAEIASAVSGKELEAVMIMWGDAPTVQD